MTVELDRVGILRALERLSELLEEKGVLGEICLVGGAAMVLAFNARASTKDIDAIFYPTQVIMDLALRVQAEQGLPENWLNDAAKGFLSDRHEVTAGDLPQFSNLRVTIPVAEYLLAMKCMASRITYHEGERGDIPDIRYLVRHLHLTSVEQALAIVSRYYPEERIPPRAQYLLEDVFADLEDTV
jgi:hypothetical protein